MKIKKNEFYTYLYRDPKNGIEIYVGKGVGSRVNHHIKYPTNRHLGNLIRKRIEEGFEILPEITYHKNENTALAMEIFWIAVYGRKDKGTGSLFNLTDGGEGTTGVVRSEETLKKLSVARKGKTHTEESKKLMSDKAKGRPGTNLGKPMSDETKEKLSKSKTGKSVGKGRKASAAAREANRQGQKKRFEDTPGTFTGLTHSDDSKEKISKANSGSNNGMFGKGHLIKGRKHSDEAKANMKKARQKFLKNKALAKSLLIEQESGLNK